MFIDLQTLSASVWVNNEDEVNDEYNDDDDNDDDDENDYIMHLN